MLHITDVELAWLIGALALLVVVLAALAWRLRQRALLAEAGERLAVERRDRFLSEAAAALQEPLDAFGRSLRALGPSPPASQVDALLEDVAELRTLVATAARLPPGAKLEAREDVDLAELVRGVLDELPFADIGPAVIVRAQSALVRADRSRLENGLRILLWVLRRHARELVVTVSSDRSHALLELAVRTDAMEPAREVVEAFEAAPGVAYGIARAPRPAQTTLALRVAEQVARLHGGRLYAGTRAPGIIRFSLELPSSKVA